MRNLQFRKCTELGFRQVSLWHKPVSITATELKANLGKYLLLAATEDVFITQYGKVIAKLTNPYQEKIDIATSLFGILPQTMTFEEAREERLNDQ